MGNSADCAVDGATQIRESKPALKRRLSMPDQSGRGRVRDSMEKLPPAAEKRSRAEEMHTAFVVDEKVAQQQAH